MRVSLLDRLKLLTCGWRTRKPPTQGKPSGFLPEQDDAPESSDYSPSPEDCPVFPPPAPRVILGNKTQYWDTVIARKFGAPEGVFEDSSLFALYRLYEFIALDRVIDYRNCLEAFWRQRSWAVQDIPDPKDDNAERYAFLAGCTYLLVRSFNEHVALGLRRDNPSLITAEEAEAATAVPAHLRPRESIPTWPAAVPPLEDALVVPTLNGMELGNREDPKADSDFLHKNILIWKPHISFT